MDLDRNSHSLLGLCLSAVLIDFIITATVVIEKYACFNTVFDVSCGENEMLVFDSVRFGRNDSAVALRCDVPFSFNCDVDVQFQVNRACAGRRHCSFDVGVDLFTDPCGYEEFLRVRYLCAPASGVHSGCSGHQSPVLFDRGFVSSPNYPDKYYMDAVCLWTLAVHRWQTIHVTLLDFELDVKRAGDCHDYLQIASASGVYFRECGVLGKQSVDVPTNTVSVTFQTGETSLTQRGFFLSFEAVGPGCPDLPEPDNARISYYVDGGSLYANVSCNEGFRMNGADDSGGQRSMHRLIHCNGLQWNNGPMATQCELSPSTEAAAAAASSSSSSALLRLPAGAADPSGGPGGGGGRGDANRSVAGSLPIHYGIVLTLVSSVLIVVLASLLATYICKRRRRTHQKLDKWRVVINNLHGDSMLRPGQKQHFVSGLPGVSCHLANDCAAVDRRRFLGKLQRPSTTRPEEEEEEEEEEEWQGRKLLASRDHSEDDDDEDEYAFSCAIDRQVDGNLLAMSPFLCRLCSSHPVFDCVLNPKRAPPPPQQRACPLRRRRSNTRFGTAPPTGPDSKRDGAEFSRFRRHGRQTGSFDAEAAASGSGPRAVDCGGGGGGGGGGAIRGWPLLRAVSKSAPDVSFDLCQPVFCYSSFLELGWNGRGRGGGGIGVYGGRCSECRNRNRRKAFRRASTVDSIRSPCPQMGSS